MNNINKIIIKRVVNMDFSTIYPNIMKYYNLDKELERRIKVIQRKKKIKKILEDYFLK